MKAASAICGFLLSYDTTKVTQSDSSEIINATTFAVHLMSLRTSANSSENFEGCLS